MTYAKITGLGSFLPERLLTNYDLEKIIDTTNEWIVERSGIKTRHIANPQDTVVSMAEKAARQALQNASITADKLDLIIIATCSSEYLFPSSACLLQKQLKADNAFAFDISAACSGFVYALTVAEKFIQAGSAKHVLVVGSEAMSRVINWEDRTTCVLFGDGAGAVILSASSIPGIIASKLYSDGTQAEILYLPSGIKASAQIEAETMFIKMQGKEVFRLAVERLASAVLEILHQANMTLVDIDWIVPHQANSRIISMIINRLKISESKVIVTVDKHANTSSASIPLALHEAVKCGKIKPGQTLLFEAFGGGLTWGSVLLKF
ncbi:MAG: 3-oxoacyl-ACP synthase [Gammaproteobacteria bacterium RIFCSPHIGHO2_12_FULL_35_23]|nr:MAG: 3-oxoacyl-ACP synthase [Gammaproteobacteria bacterium RIFCSPHIGHO2_12_FULL_35_23]